MSGFYEITYVEINTSILEMVDAILCLIVKMIKKKLLITNLVAFMNIMFWIYE